MSGTAIKNKKMLKQEGIHHRDTEARSVIRLLDLLPSPHRVLRAFCVGRNALRKMHATLCVEREGDQGDESCSVPPCLCGESPLVFYRSSQRLRSNWLFGLEDFLDDINLFALGFVIRPNLEFRENAHADELDPEKNQHEGSHDPERTLQEIGGKMGAKHLIGQVG